MPPSCRFPPLREGNREKRARSVPPAGRGNLKEGVFSRACFHKLCPRGWYNWFYLLPESQRGTQGWVPLAFDEIIHDIGGGSYTALDNSNNPIGEYTVPVSGYYMISANVNISNPGGIFINGTIALQRQVSNNNWEILGAYYSKMYPLNSTQHDGQTIHGVFYLNQGDKIRVAAYNRSNALIAPRRGDFFDDPPFVSQNHHLTIYLLSAADAPQ